MKALNNDSTIYTQGIVSAINDCYQQNSEPTNTELMELYSFVGQCICEQGEKAFVVHLAQILGSQLPQIKGFSPRNLRRMRDFYRTYENQPDLMHKAQTLGWTQNTVILECCENNEQRAFYIRLAAEKNLSKLALTNAIESSTFETASAEQAASADLITACPTVDNDTEAEAVDTTSPTENPCGAFVTACEPLRQGSGLPTDKKQKRSSRPASDKAAKLLTYSINILHKSVCRLWLLNRPPKQPPPKRWRDLEMNQQRIAFA